MLFLLAFYHICVSAAVVGFDTRQVSVFFDGFNASFSLNTLDSSATAMAVFEDSLNVTGWGILNVKTSAKFSDLQQGYAAGFAEGVLTAPRIWEHFLNMRWVFFQNEEPDHRLIDFFNAQDAWTRNQTASNPSDPFWQQVGHLLAQVDGLRDGYNAVSGLALDNFAFWFLNSDGDLSQIIPAVMREKRPDFDHMAALQIENYLAENSRCSSLIKLTGNFSNLFMGHSTWYTYSSTNRIFKHYHFSLSNPRVASNTMSFSSYPGVLVSIDDYYLMPGSGLGMVQTSLVIVNASLYDLIKPESLLAWYRVRVANHLAHSGQEWYDLLRIAASGTYCNTYMVVDFNKFTPGQGLVDDLLWIIEEIPGVCVGRDLTSFLQFGYWPSYNVPFQPEVVTLSGYTVLSKRGVASADFQLAPRAEIFRRDNNEVTDLDSFKNLLRSNRYKTDPYAKGNACAQICCRGDLANGRAGGCYDTKVTDFQNFWSGRSWIINGPSTDSNLPPFNWSGFVNVSHIGLPPTFQFAFQDNQPLPWDSSN